MLEVGRCGASAVWCWYECWYECWCWVCYGASSWYVLVLAMEKC